MAERKVTAIEQVTSGVSDGALSRALWEVAKEVSRWAADTCPVNSGLDTSNPFTAPINWHC